MTHLGGSRLRLAVAPALAAACLAAVAGAGAVPGAAAASGVRAARRARAVHVTHRAVLRWRTIADGPAAGNLSLATVAYVALSRSTARRRFSARLSGAAVAKLRRVDFARDALVAIFGEFGCRDPLIAVESVLQHGRTLAVRLVQRPPKPGTVECMAIFATYRFLLVPKSQLRRPLPVRATVTIARA